MKPETTYSKHNFFWFFFFYFYNLAFLPSLTEVKTLTCAICKFQTHMRHKKASCIDPSFHDIVYYLTTTDSIAFLSSSFSKRTTKVVRFAFPRFYNSFWLINVDIFPQAVIRFEEIVTCSQDMDFSIQQSITSMVMLAV